MAAERQFEGKNVAEAAKKACTQLNIPEESLQYEIISHGSSGIFGIVGVKKARISVILKDEKPEENSPCETQNPDEGSLGAINENVLDKTVDIQKIEEDGDDDLTHEDVCNSNDTNGAEFSAETIMEDDTVTGNELPEATTQTGFNAVQRIAEAIAEDVIVRMETKNNKIYYNIDCQESGVLIGKKGHTLDAIQYIVERIVANKSNGKARVRVDVCGYRNKRRALLIKIANDAAKKVQKGGKPIPLGLLNPEERKIVHETLKKKNVLCNTGKGEGYLKKLTLFPKREQASN